MDRTRITKIENLPCRLEDISIYDTCITVVENLTPWLEAVHTNTRRLILDRWYRNMFYGTWKGDYVYSLG